MRHGGKRSFLSGSAHRTRTPIVSGVAGPRRYLGSAEGLALHGRTEKIDLLLAVRRVRVHKQDALVGAWVLLYRENDYLFDVEND